MSESATPQTRHARALRAALVSVGLFLAGAGTAGAQNFGRTFFEDDMLPPRVVAWRLADRGFSGVGRPRFDGRFYIVDAVDPAGLPVRLLVDPANGAIVGRERLGGEVFARLEQPPVRSAPGYGWTEEETGPGRPMPQGAAPPLRAPPRSGPAAERAPAANPSGLNPDGPRRQETPRKVARTNPVQQPDRATPRTSPAAPAPKVAPEAAQPQQPPANANRAPEPASAPPASAPSDTPAAVTKPAASEAVRAEATPKQEWKDPPAEGKRPVRVIGGATLVPGAPEKEGEAKP